MVDESHQHHLKKESGPDKLGQGATMCQEGDPQRSGEGVSGHLRELPGCQTLGLRPSLTA